MSALNELIGKRINRITVAEDGEYIAFDTDGGTLLYQAVGDCCSRSWVEAVSNVENLRGEVVLSAEDLDLPGPNPQPEKYDSLAVYGCSINAGKGPCVIEYRNDSNGYYGGYLELREFDKKVLPIEVTSDWTCNDAERKGSWE